jgi:hypothetical protein
MFDTISRIPRLSCGPFSSRNFQRERVQHRRRLVRDRTRRELGVFLGHPRVGVAEEHLHLEQTHATLDEPGREGVTEGVTGGATVSL